MQPAFAPCGQLVRAREVDKTHTDESLLKRFKAIDLNGNGKIEVVEYLQWALQELLGKYKDKVSPPPYHSSLATTDSLGSALAGKEREPVGPVRWGLVLASTMLQQLCHTLAHRVNLCAPG